MSESLHWNVPCYAPPFAISLLFICPQMPLHPLYSPVIALLFRLNIRHFSIPASMLR